MSRLRDVAAFCSLALLWGLSLAAVEFGLRSFPPLLLSAFRYYLATGLLFAYVWVRDDGWRPTTRGDLLAVCGGGIGWIALGNGVWFVGQALTSSVLSGVMVSLIPITTTAVSWVFLPEDRLTPASLVGLAVSFVGGLVLVWPADATGVTTAVVGKLLLLVGVLGTAFGSVFIRRASATLPNSAQTAWATLVGAVCIHVLSVVTGEGWAGSVTPTGAAALVYLALGSTAVAYVLFFSLLDRHAAIEVTLVSYLVPVVAAVTGLTLFGEPITRSVVAGFALVLGGFVLLKRRALRATVRRVRAGS